MKNGDENTSKRNKKHLNDNQNKENYDNNISHH